MKIGQTGERAQKREMDQTRSPNGAFVLKIMLEVKTVIGWHAMKEMPTTTEIINQINHDKGATIAPCMVYTKMGI